MTRVCGACLRGLQPKETCLCGEEDRRDMRPLYETEDSDAMWETIPGTPRARREKLNTHDEWAAPALMALIKFMEDEPGLVCAAAKGRHAEGSLRFGDTLMYEYDDATLRAEALQELADAVNYFVVLLSREKQP